MTPFVKFVLIMVGISVTHDVALKAINAYKSSK